ncbi:hypothetical protein BpHYR1_008433 [Brachionus plicatilis]|uniref:Uncharacterized protein n=1 Tax=Brachionus plicatilis TaxID=10195 RepID=A0A3M7SBE8_BRAPC|nr:hypothetical protein BpHYR1_008433 [Brachionus plicatilis]
MFVFTNWKSCSDIILALVSIVTVTGQSFKPAFHHYFLMPSSTYIKKKELNFCNFMNKETKKLINFLSGIFGAKNESVRVMCGRIFKSRNKN